MEQATASDVIAIFGALDEDLVARIVAVGPTRAELLEVKAWMAADHALGPEGKTPTGAAKEVCDLLDAADAELLEEDVPVPAPEA